MEQFESAVQGNPNLRNAEKLIYLKSSLWGKAHDLVKNVAITDVSYELARMTLMDRIENKKFIVSMHISAMLIYPTWKLRWSQPQEAFGVFSLKSVSFEVQGCYTQDWDPIPLCLIEQKLYTESQKQWQIHIPWVGLQKLHQSLINSTKSTIRIEAHADDQSKIDGIQSVGATTVDEKFVFCYALHTVTACNEFKRLKAHTWKDEVTTKWICFNLSRPGHMVTNGPSTHNFKKCGKLHHYHLHVDDLRREQPNTNEMKTVNDYTTSGKKLCTVISATETDRTALFGTYRIPLFNPHRLGIFCRALIDIGLHLNFFSESFL